MPPAAHHPSGFSVNFWDDYLLCILCRQPHTICLNLSDDLSPVYPMPPSAHHLPLNFLDDYLCVSDAACRIPSAWTCPTIYPLCIRCCQPHTIQLNLSDDLSSVYPTLPVKHQPPKFVRRLSTVYPMPPAIHRPPKLVEQFILCVSDTASRTPFVGWFIHCVSDADSRTPSTLTCRTIYPLCIWCRQPHTNRRNLSDGLSSVYLMMPAAHQPPELAGRFILCVSDDASCTPTAGACRTIYPLCIRCRQLHTNRRNLSDDLSSVYLMTPAAHQPPELVRRFILCVSDDTSCTTTAGACRTIYTIYPLCIRCRQPHTNRRNLADMMLKAGN